MNVEVIKPDHIGDLVLSVPAINYLLSKHDSLRLHVNPSNVAIAKYLFPAADVKIARFPHLDKASHSTETRLEITSGDQIVIALRNDQYIVEYLSRIKFGQMLMVNNDQKVHETELQKQCLRPLGDYNPSDYWPRKFAKKNRSPRKIGLCLSAGFVTNSISLYFWYELALALIRNGIEVTLIGGPSEVLQIGTLSKWLIHQKFVTVIGGPDFGSFLHEVSKVELVVASDSGTAHLCSLVRPVVSLFGPSPFERFRPFGDDCFIISNNLPCRWRCDVFSKNSINKCVTRECGVFKVESVLQSIYE